MRSKEEILEDLNRRGRGSLELEVLIDIRDVLSNLVEKSKPKIKATKPETNKS